MSGSSLQTGAGRPRSFAGLSFFLLLATLRQAPVPRSFLQSPSRLRGFRRRGPAPSHVTFATAERTTLVEEAVDAEASNSIEKLCFKLPLLTGRQNHTEDSLEFKVSSDESLGVSVKLKLPALRSWQHVRGSGRVLRERKLPSFTQNGDTLLKAKEAAASEALRTLFRTLNTRLSNSNNKELAKYLASLFEDAVELVQLRLKGDPEERSPGNVLYSLAYLAREPYPLTPEKRMLTASHVKTLPEGGYQVFIQQKQRLTMPAKAAKISVSAETAPKYLVAKMEKALREKNALKLQLAGTKAAEQVVLALAMLNFPHRFSCYFMKSDFQNATGLEVQVARRWRPL